MAWQPPAQHPFDRPWLPALPALLSFAWLSPVLRLGRRRRLSADDFFPLPTEEAATRCVGRVAAAWAREAADCDGSKQSPEQHEGDNPHAASQSPRKTKPQSQHSQHLPGADSSQAGGQDVLQATQQPRSHTCDGAVRRRRRQPSFLRAVLLSHPIHYACVAVAYAFEAALRVLQAWLVGRIVRLLQPDGPDGATDGYLYALGLTLANFAYVALGVDTDWTVSSREMDHMACGRRANT